MPSALTGRDLVRWRLIEDFQGRLAQAAAQSPLAPTGSDPKRLLQYTDYLSLFLLGLLNPGGARCAACAPPVTWRGCSAKSAPVR